MNCEGVLRKFSSADLVGCFLLTHCAKKHPFILISPKFIFHTVNYVLQCADKNFSQEIICSYVSDYDEKAIEGLS